MAYQPLIPGPNDFLSQSQQDIKNNFTSANNSFSVDHTAFDVGVNPGYHKVVHQIPFSDTTSNPPNNQPVSAPGAIGGIGQIFTAQINDGYALDEALYFESGGGKLTQFTRNFTPKVTTPIATFLPGGLIIFSGEANIGDNLFSIFPNGGFKNNNFGVFTTFKGTPNGVNSTLGITTRTLTGFGYLVNLSSGSLITGFCWWAIGN